jgi:hypothetical protein
MDETSVGPLKPAGVEIEPSKLLFKIDVKPLAAGGFGIVGGLPHELTTDPSGCRGSWCPPGTRDTLRPTRG